MNEPAKFFFVFFVVTIPCTIAALHPPSNLSILLRLAALGSFVLFAFAISYECI
jgi:hypothetical protein